MDEDFKDVTANSKKMGIIFVLIIVAIMMGGYFFVFKPIYFSVKTVEVELGSEIPTEIEAYLGSYGGKLSDYELNLGKIDKDTVGEYTYTITNKKITKKGKIVVVDTEAPTFTLQDMTIEEGDEDYFLGSFLATCEDKSKPCLVNLKNAKDESKFKTPGTHTIEIEVSDVYGNKESGKVNLTVVEKGKYTDPKSLDLEYASNSKKTETFDGLIYKKLEKAIEAQTDQARDEMNAVSTLDLESYVTANHPGYKLVSSEIIELYNKSDYVIGYAIELKITNGKEKIVYVDSTKVLEQPIEDGTEEEDTEKDETT